MKKTYPYLVGAVILLFLVVLLVASRSKPSHHFDERITLRQRDKIPYGTAAARQLLPTLFSDANVYTDARYPGAWDGVNVYTNHQAVILMADFFDADSEELEHLNRFVGKGNSVFIIAQSFSYSAANFFHLTLNGFENFFALNDGDSLRVKLERPTFSTDSLFIYPGRRYQSSIVKFDTTRTAVLGRNEMGQVNFIQMNKGSGRFFVHTAPLAFSNYFILHKHNIAYFQQALSVLPQDSKAVLWNEYYLDKQQNPREKDVNWLGALFKQPAFRWAFLTALATLLIAMLLGMRRRQRLIPPHGKPVNDSLDFVKTLGRLYYDKHDHKNLAEKMGTYFLEHVRSRYKIATHTLDDDFIKLLHAKSGYPEPEIKNIVVAINQLPEWPNISEEKLALFHKSLELFYQNT